jgi:cholesterol transport system auxiliary component
MAGRHRWWQATPAALIGLIAASCSSAPPQTFDLSAVDSGLASARARAQLEVIEPTTSIELDSNRIVIRTSPEAIAYLSGAQWTGRLPTLVQTRLVQTFENAKLLQSVGRPGEHFTADYALTTEIRSFEINVPRGEAVVEIVAKIVSETSGRVIAAQIFSAKVPTQVKEEGAPATALDHALAEVMRAIVRWTATKI